MAARRLSPAARAAASLSRSAIDFQNGRTAYANLSTWDLVRAYGVFSVCGIRFVVDNSDRLLNLGLKILGSGAIKAILRPTLFGHFCGGEDLETIRPTIARLEAAGVGGILDYAAEADIKGEEGKVDMDDSLSATASSSTLEAAPVTTRKGKALARQYSYHTEARCDENQKIFETAIRAVHGVTPDGFAAIKVTALGNPLLLERWSSALREAHSLFTMLDINKDDQVTFDEFRKMWAEIFVDVDGAILEREFQEFDPKKTGRIDPVAWLTTLDPPKMRQLAEFCKEESPFGNACLDAEEEQLLDAMRTRLSSLVKIADELGVRLMVDAEHTYFQPAIDNLVLGVQREYNKTTDRVYGTIQCYLKDAPRRNKLFMQQAEEEGWVYAAKIVRGAYMYQERERAEKRGEPDPIHDTPQDTHDCYNAVMRDILTRQTVQIGKEKANLVVATHNQRSVEQAIQLIDQAGLTPEDSGVAFGQLLGMADHLTFTLGAKGYKAYKYIPYGPILETLPYLIRRAQENSDLMGSVGYELGMLRKEIYRRLTPF
mmetsp:Transcript_37035/g.71429  ORF Transcript_37035/g.71429 Transcript_37035/m.71429 type:complete len:543 (+) Transcript_37035:20-1648(+)